MNLLGILIDFYLLIILARVIVSWLAINPDNQIVGMIYTLTEPVLQPVRKVLPAVGGLDFSPKVVFFGVQLLRKVIGL